MQKSPRGIALIEGLLAAALVAIFAGAIAGVYLSVSRTERQEIGDIEARFLSHGGLEAARMVRDSDSAAFTPGTYGIATSSGSVSFSGSSDTYAGFTRSVTVSEVATDTFRTVALTADDISSKTFVTYLTRWREALASLVGDWSDIDEADTLDLSGSSNGWKVQVMGDYAYVVRSGGNPDFYVIDISDPESMDVVDTLSLSGTPQNIALSGDYAYVTSSSNSQELIVINITNPSSVSRVGSLNLSGNSNAYGIAIEGSIAYVGRSNDELYVINIAVPASPALLGSEDLDGDGNDVVVVGNYAYVATTGDELETVDISNPLSPNSVDTLNLGGGNDAEAIVYSSGYLYLGRSNGVIEVISISDPDNPEYERTFSDIGSAIRDMALGNNDNYIFVASDTNSGEFAVVDISDRTDPELLGVYNAPNDFNGVAYSEDYDIAVAVGDNNSEEVAIYVPN